MWMRRWMCIRPSCCRCRIIEDNPLLGACCVNWYYFSLQSWKWKCLDHVKYWCIGWCVCFKGWLDNMVFQFSWQRYRISSLVYLCGWFDEVSCASLPCSLINPLWFEENGNVKMMERSVWFCDNSKSNWLHVVWAIEVNIVSGVKTAATGVDTVTNKVEPLTNEVETATTEVDTVTNEVETINKE